MLGKMAPGRAGDPFNWVSMNLGDRAIVMGVLSNGNFSALLLDPASWLVAGALGLPAGRNLQPG